MFAVDVSIPVSVSPSCEDRSRMEREVSAEALEQFYELPKLFLLHCSAGTGRKRPVRMLKSSDLRVRFTPKSRRWTDRMARGR